MSKKKIWNPSTNSWEEQEIEDSLWDPSSGGYTTQSKYTQLSKSNAKTTSSANVSDNTTIKTGSYSTFKSKDKSDLTATKVNENKKSTIKEGSKSYYTPSNSSSSNHSNKTITTNGKNYSVVDNGRSSSLVEQNSNSFQNPYNTKFNGGVYSYAPEVKNYGSIYESGPNNKKHDLSKLTFNNFIATATDQILLPVMNTGNLIAKGTVKKLENVYDWTQDASSYVNDGAAYKLGIIDKEEYERRRAKTRDDIAYDFTENLWTDTFGWDDEVRQYVNNNSFVNENNILGQTAEAFGGMIPSLMVGQATGLGDVSTSYQSLKGLTTGQKILTGTTNFGKAMLYNLPTNATLGISTYGSALEEAYANGATDSQAAKYAIYSTALEISSEWLTSGIPGLNQTGLIDKGADFLIDKATGKISNEAIKGITKSLLKHGYSMVGEGFEEGLVEILTPIIKNATYSESEEINWGNVVNSFIVGSIVGGILNLPGTTSDIRNSSAVVSNPANIQDNVSIEKTIDNDNSKNGSVELATVEELEQSRNIEQDDLELPSNIEKVSSVQDENQNNVIKESLKKNEEAALNEVSKRIKDNPYQFQKTDNDKINKLRESASLYLDNSKETQNLINTIEKVINDKNYNIVFDNSIFNQEGNIVNAQIRTLENGEIEIKINPNSKRAGEFLLMHEITHAIQTDELIDFVMDYASKNPKFDEALESLKKTYGTENVSDEVLADVCGQLFGNQEFINNLSTTKPSLFKRIYNSLVSLANKLTGNSKEHLFIEDLKNKWQKAYSNNVKSVEIETRYSLIGKKGLKNAIEQDKTNKLVKKELNKARFYDFFGLKTNDQLRKEHGWFKDANNNWTAELSDKDSKFIKELEPNKKYKLGEIFYHHDLFEAYPEIKNVEVITKKMSKYNPAAFNPTTNQIALNNQMLKDSTLKSSFLHEIQHKIQSIEGWEQGDSGDELDMYFANLGEISASEIEKRSELSYKELRNTPLELTKPNPVHYIVRDIYNKGKDSQYYSFLSNNKFAKLYNEIYNKGEVGDYDRKRISKKGVQEKNKGISNSISVSNDITQWRSVSSGLHNSRNEEGVRQNTSRNEQTKKGLDDSSFSLYEDNKWQRHLDKNYNSSGTLTNLKDIKVKYRSNSSDTVSNQSNFNEKNYFDYVKDNVKILNEEISNYKKGKISNNLRYLLEGGFELKDIKSTLKNIEKDPFNVVNNGARLEKRIRKSLEVGYDKYLANQETNKKGKNQIKIGTNEDTITNLEKYKKDTVSRLEEKIKEKEKLYESKKNKDTKVANQIQQQIEWLKNQIENRKVEYDDRINRLKERNTVLQEKENSIEFKRQEQRQAKQEEYKELAYEMTENMVDWTDKKRGLSYQINTMKRNLYDIMSEKEASKMYDAYFKPITENNAKAEKFINSYNERIKELKLNDKESQAVQMWGEYKYNKDTLVTGMEIDNFISENKLNYEKIKKSAEVFRSIYDELIVKTNEILVEQGYKPIDYRKGYFPHFVEETAETRFGKLAEKLGFKVNKDTIPTNIAGITDKFKPGKTWFRNAQQRKGKYTDFNALKGFDNYIRGAADTIFHTEDIQKLRALEEVIRYQYTDPAIKTELEKINNDTTLNLDEKTERVEAIKAKISNPLGNFATELRNYTDAIANKKSIGDRSMEQTLGRETYSIMSNIQSRVSANMVGFNISSALTNFIPITQAYSQISTKNMAKAMRDSISSQHKSDNLSDASTFLTNRLNKADRLYKTKLDTINQKASFLFECIDDFTSNVIVRGKFYENIENGMSEVEALKNADEFAKDVMAGRDKGSMPTIFNKKNPVVKLFTAFQLEVNNQYGYMLKDMPRDLKNEGLNKLVGSFIKMFLGAWLYNKFSETVTGRKSAFSPIDIVTDAIETSQQENMSNYDKFSTILTDIVGEVPFIGGMVGGGRLPISSALPDFATTGEALFDLADDEKREQAIKTLSKELIKPAFYIVTPFGGGQLKKSIEGISMYTKDIPGSYTSSGRLRFEADTSPMGIVQNVIFGQYSSKNAREYFDKGYAPLTQKQQEEIKKLDISVSEYRKYRTEYTKLNKIKADKDEKGNSIAGTASGKKAYSIMNNDSYSKKQKEYLLSSISESEVSIEDLKKLDNDEEIYKYFFGLNKENKEAFLEAIDNYDFSSRDLVEYSKYRKNANDTYVSVVAKQTVVDYINQSDLNDNQKLYLYFKDYGSEQQNKLIANFNVGASNYLNTVNYVSYIKDNFSGEYYSDYRKEKIFSYINSLNATIPQKIALFKVAGYSVTSYKSSMYKYINSLNLTKNEKEELWNYLY